MISLARDKRQTEMNGTAVQVAALLRSSESQDAVTKAIAGERDTTLRTKVSKSLDIATLKGLHGDVILLDVDVGDAGEMQALAEFVADRTSAPVVVTSSSLSITCMRELMQIGVLDVIPQPLDRADVAATLRKALRRRQVGWTPSHGKRGRVISFLGSGSGAGATSLAVQGACALTRRKDAERLCLLDLDVQFGISALLMDTASRGSIIDLIRDPERLDGALLRGAMARAHDRFDLLGAPPVVHPVDAIDPDAIIATIATATSEYAHTILDLPLLWSLWTHAALRTSSVIVLVVQLTVPSLRQGRRQIDMLGRENLDDIPLVVVANRVETGLFRKSDLSVRNAAKALGRPVDHVVPNSAAMLAAADSGLPLSEVKGGRSLEKKIGLVMKEIIKAGQRAQPHAIPAGG